MKTMNYCFFLFFLFYVNNSFAAYSVVQDNGTQTTMQSSSPNSLPVALEEDEETAHIHLDAIIKSCSGATVQRIYSIIKRLNNPACPAKLKPKKMLIIGPSGVGKSTLAQSIARFIERPCKFIKATDLLTKYQHSGCENLLREVRAVLNQRKPYVIVIDEMNCLIDGFSKETNQDKETATALWLALDECCAREDILFIGTMNDSETIPGPIETRFKNHTIKIPLPSYAARRNILLYFLRDIDHTITRKNLSELCSKTAGLSGRELEELVTQALSFAYERHSVGACITQKDMLHALNIIRPHGAFITQLRYIFTHKQELLSKAMPYIFPAILSFVGLAFQYYMSQKQNEMLKIANEERDINALGLRFQHAWAGGLMNLTKAFLAPVFQERGIKSGPNLDNNLRAISIELGDLIDFNKITGHHADDYHIKFLSRNNLKDPDLITANKNC